MNKQLGILGGLGIGAGLMYLFDPDRGRRRRMFIRDKALHFYRTEARVGDTLIRQIVNKTRGILAESEKLLSNEPVDDDVLVERIRAMLGRVVTHPAPIEVTAIDGHVTLGGHILKNEIPDLLAAVKRVPGVKRVENMVQGHAESENLPFLRPAVVPMVAKYKAGLPPSAKMVMGGVGGTIAAIGLRRGGALGGTLGVLGLGMLARATSARERRRLTRAGIAARQRKHAQTDVQQEVSMAAPAFRDYEEEIY
jgi:hypothetical protein